MMSTLASLKWRQSFVYGSVCQLFWVNALPSAGNCDEFPGWNAANLMIDSIFCHSCHMSYL